MKHKRVSAVILAAAILVSLAACNTGEEESGTNLESSSHSISIGSESAGESVTPETAPELPTVSEPTEGEYEARGETVIHLGESITVEGEGATVEGTTVTVARSGTYLISGTSTDGQVVVNTSDKSTVTLILNGAAITSANGPAIYVQDARDVVISTVAGSINLLADTAGYIVPDEEQVEGETYPNACVYACTDLFLAGDGELYITGNADKGINTKDTLMVVSGTVGVTAAGVGIRANDGLGMESGRVTVVSGGDGVKTANTEKAGKGHMAITGGTLYVTAQGDALSAATDLTVMDGTLVLTTLDENGEGLKESNDNPTSGSMGGMGGGRPGDFGGRPGDFGGRPGESTSDKTTTSAKGLKATGNLSVSGGKITIVAQDDGLHADGDITVSGGTLHIRSADDGMHAEGELTISGGATEIAQSYEGLEALHITVSGGQNRITASDDGANATSGEGGGFGGGATGGRPGMGGWGSSGSIEFSDDQPCLTFAGGYTVFNAAGDGIDSNGWIKMTGGTVLVYGPTDNGNGPIDFGDGGYNMAISGGIFLAVGSSGMAETAENNGQAILAAYWNRTGLAAGDTVGIVDGDGNILAAFELPKAIASIVFSSPDIEAGKSYSLVTGGTFTGEAVDGVISPATYTGFESMGDVEAY